MIYHLYWDKVSRTNNSIADYIKNSHNHEGLEWARDIPPFKGQYSPPYNTKKMLAEFILESKQDSFVFVLINSQLKGFDAWLEEHKLKDLIIFKMERAVTNGNHHDYGRNLNLLVMCSKTHEVWDMFKTEEEMELV